MTEPNDSPMDFHILRVEVTVAAGIQQPDGHMLGRNMVEATLSFGWRTGDPPDGITDAEVNQKLAEKIGPVLSLIQTALTFNGWVAMGIVDDPMTEHSKPTGELGSSAPATVRVSFVGEQGGVHD